ncbi:MAG: alpha/beta hydrolase [Clostridia bacterium]|nr:alpha/beta hydrolase [Clostridia bacterium]
MSKTIKKKMGRYHVEIYPTQAEGTPFVYTNSFMEAGGELIKLAEKEGAPPFQLISISHLDWDVDLSPWPAPSVISRDDNFQGHADMFCDFITGEVVPFAEQELGEKPAVNVLAGYSMAGLFALYAPYRTEMFDKLVCASGSVWYPNFVEYVKQHPYPKKPACIYLSLGDKETHTKNPYLQTTHTCMTELEACFLGAGIDTVFETNEGGHHDHAVRREARGIIWALRAKREQV